MKKPIYNKYIKGSASYEYNSVNKRLKDIAINSYGKILDLGHARQPNPYLKGNITGLDLGHARNNIYTREVIGDIMEAHIIFKGQKFNTIIAGEVIEHLGNPLNFLLNIKKLMYKYSCLIITTPNPVSFTRVLGNFLFPTKSSSAKGHIIEYIPKWIIRLGNIAGLECIDYKSTGRFKTNMLYIFKKC